MKAISRPALPPGREVGRNLGVDYMNGTIAGFMLITCWDVGIEDQASTRKRPQTAEYVSNRRMPPFAHSRGVSYRRQTPTMRASQLETRLVLYRKHRIVSSFQCSVLLLYNSVGTLVIKSVYQHRHKGTSANLDVAVVHGPD